MKNYLPRYTITESICLSDCECRACFDLLYERAAAFGGLLSGEHGIGVKIPWLERFVGEANLQLMQRIKRAFDPNLILNPGKVCIGI